ncbi:MAG: hypothetical protein J6B23_09220 [Clostridia bacterium]|nr:hypothetical protein [Clostridia bacterium]
MKKVLRKSISILLSCIMILSCMSVVSIAETPTVTVIKGPSGSYERILYTGTTTYDDIGKMWFNLTLDEGWQEIKVTDSVGTELFMATDASGLEVAADSSYFFGIKASSIPAIGDEVLTLSVKYSDEYTFTKDFNVNTYVAYANLAVDMDAATAFSASGLGLTSNDSASAKNYAGDTLNTEFTDGFAGKAPSDKVIKFTNLGQSVSFITKYFFGGIIGDSVVEFDMYYDISAEAGLSVIGPKTTTWPQVSIARPALPAAYINTWVTVRCVFDSDAKTMTEYIVKDGEIVNTVTTVDLSANNFATLFDENGDLKVYGYKIDFRTLSYTAGRINGIDNVKMMQVVSDKADIVYTDANGTYPAFNSIISADATSASFTLDPMFVGLGDSYIEKADGTDAGASLSFNANVITLTSALSEGEYNLVVPSSSDVKRNDLFLGGNMKIPFKVADMNEALASTITITAPQKANVGKNVTIGVDFGLAPESASLYFGDTLITSDIQASNTYFIPAHSQLGDAEIKVKATYSVLTEEVVKSVPVAIVGSDIATETSVMDFEKYESQRFASYDEALAALDWRTNSSHISPLTSNMYKDYGYIEIAENEITGKAYKVGVDAPEGSEPAEDATQAEKDEYTNKCDILVGESYVHVYSLDAKRVTYGKFNLDFDVYMNGFWGAGLNVTPLSIAGHGHKAVSVVSNNVIAGTDVSLGSGYAWHHVSLVFDVDNMKVYGKFDDTEIPAQNITWASGLKTGDYHAYIGIYRIGARVYGDGNYYLLDNIETGLAAPILNNMTYTDGETTANAYYFFPATASALTLNFSRAYKALTAEDIEIRVNDAVVATPEITYDATAKTAVIPTASLGLKAGDSIDIAISADEIMADDTVAGEVVNAFAKVIGANGFLEITKYIDNGVATVGVATSENRSFTVIVAAYNGNKLVGTTSRKINPVAGVSSFDTSITLPSEYTDVKCFTWDSVAGLKPVADIK